MALNSRILVNMPESGIIIRRSGKYQYVYKVLSAYRDEKGQPTNDRVSIGRFDAASAMLIPNNNYYEHYQAKAGDIEILPAYDSIRSVGATIVVKRIFTDLGLAGILERVLGSQRASLALTSCIYMVCRGNVMEYVLDYCESFTLHETPLTPQGASALFASITYQERMSFFRAWVSLQQHPQYLAYDVTSFSSYAQGIADTEWGYNRDKEKLPQINMGCYLGQQSGLPVFYVTYPGSIVDKSHLKYMMAYNTELGIRDVGFVMDRGFCTTDNVGYLHEEHIPFIIGVEMRHKATKAAIDRVRENISSMRYHVGRNVFARSVHDRFYGVASTMHIYYDTELGERQRRDLFRTIERDEEKLVQLEQITLREAKQYSVFFDIDRMEDGSFTFARNYDKIDSAALNNGFFCILSNTEFGSKKILEFYRRKDVIEKGFDDLKNHLDMKRMRTHTSETTDGKLFLAFVSLIAISHLGIKLADVMDDKSMSKDGVISELEKIKIVVLADNKRLMNPLTKLQRLLMEPFGIDDDFLKSYVTAS